MTNHVIPDLAQRIVAAIEWDFSVRGGISQEWEQIDKELQQEIRDKWADVIRLELKKPE
ncbi:MAG: hypothetical protein Q7S87_18065 [Agitococcus sp.]|nr:hypothetical protein [Agitococcus sp.]